ncbi:MAG: amidohydrolase [Bacteroidetes bacterium]|nr:amidohydrolase [Bacteroidota bacterium]MBU1484426.1 amidohydrolase [Bacteroidota bacterium]MBU2046989.1 amidohydrolase [Bacteroidota bacterium]MBU2376387.1 amidohydrolase [Bacteroidota bacterium]
MINELVQIRQYLHQHPEISGQELETSKFLLKKIKAFKPSQLIENIGGSGFLVVYDSGEDGLSLLFRTELDGLPIQETSELSYQSVLKGNGHQCGHDGHMTILIGLAQEISKNPLTKGKVSLLFQPAEETGEGAEAVLNDSKFNQLYFDEVFALHNLPGEEFGSIVVKNQAFTAAVKSIIIKLKGKTAHAAEPENGINPALAVADILQKTTELSHNDPKADDFGLITPIHVNIGEKAYGVSAGDAEIHFTYRCWTNQQLKGLENQLITTVKNIALKYQLELEYEFLQSFYANENDKQSVDVVRKSAQNLNFKLIEKEFPFKWGEDFGYFTQKFKGCLFGLGSGLNQPALHHPDYDFPDQLIPYGVKVFKEIIQQRLNHV